MLKYKRRKGLVHSVIFKMKDIDLISKSYNINVHDQTTYLKNMEKHKR